MIFPWPGAPLFSGTGLWPGKRASACGESSLAWRQPLAWNHSVTRSCPKGCNLFSALRLESHPSGGFPVCPIAVSRSGKKIFSVLSVSPWLAKASTVCGAKGICVKQNHWWKRLEYLAFLRFSNSSLSTSSFFC